MIYIGPIVMMLLGILPTRDLVFLEARYRKKIIIINFLFQLISLIIYLLCINNELNLSIFCYSHASLTIFVLVIELIISRSIYYKTLKKRILALGYVATLTKGQIRNLLIEQYNQVYPIKDIVKILKKLKWFFVCYDVKKLVKEKYEINLI